MLTIASRASSTLAQAPSLKDPTTILSLQIFLDNHDFGPGQIDGKLGSFTRKALQFYNTQQGLPKSDWRTAADRARSEVTYLYVTHRVTALDFRHVGPVAKTIPAQAKQDSLPYASVLEFIAERHHATEPFLRQLNPRIDLRQLKKGDLVVVPNVRQIFRIEAIPRSASYKRDAAKAAHYVFVDTKERMASFYRNTKLLAAFPITHGKDRYVPIGRWRITTMVTTPTFRWDESMLKRGVRSDTYHTLPPGPNNLIGIFWASINKKGIGLHGTNAPETIGRTRSAGCIRFANWDAIRLPNYVRPGCEVIVK